MKVHSAQINAVSASQRIVVAEEGKEEILGGFSVSVQWSADIGFGELQIYSAHDGSVQLRTERLGADAAKAILLKLIENAEVVE